MCLLSVFAHADFRDDVTLGAAQQHQILSRLFNLGMSYVEQGEYRAGIKYFRQMLVINPRLHRSRLELARALYQVHQYRASQYHFEIILSDNIPPAVAHNVRAYLQSIRSRVANFNVRFELINDSNINRATRQKFIYIGGLRFDVNEDSQAISKIGQGIFVNARVPISQNATWNINGHIEHREFKSKDFDYSYLNLNIGKAFEFDHHSLAVDAGRHWSGYAGHSLFYGNILGVNHQTNLENNLILRNKFTYFTLDYYERDARDASQYMIQAEIQYQTQSTHQFQFTIAYSLHNADLNIHSYQEPTLNLAWLSEWVGGWLVSASSSLSLENYKRTDPIFLKKRKDTEIRAEFTVHNRRIQMMGLTPQVHLGRTKNYSNIDFYRWDQNYLKVSFSNDF
jgi:tetratricopeptide (TPR) repeat protein